MKRGLIVFLAIVVLGSWAFSLAAYFLQDALGQYAGLVMIPTLLLPFVAAWVANSLSGGVGNMFKGLRFGSGGWVFLVWVGGLLLAYGAAVVVIAVGLQGVDFSLNSAIERTVAMAEAQGQTLPDEAVGYMKIPIFAQLIGGPLLGAWFMGALFCLVSFPWFGWFARRMLVFGVPATLAVMMGVGLLHSCVAGLMENPQLGELGMAERVIIMGLQGMVYSPLLLWLLLKTRSAVVPALAQASIYNGMTSASVLLSGSSPLLGFPMGIIPQLVILLAGLGLWVWQDPGGKELVVAGVAFDGTLLTPEMVKEQEASEGINTNPVSSEPPASQEPPAPSEP